MENEDNNINISKLRFEETALYRRSFEMSQLKDTYNELTDDTCQKPPQTVIISGYSGTGKTAVANHMRNYVKSAGGYFISGKYDINNYAEPYTALIEAFTELSDILSEDISTLFSLKNDIKEAVGTQGRALTAVIPSLHRVISQRNQLANVSPMESKHRFKYVLRNFLRGICSPDRPVVLFLDNMEWADQASLEVIHTLLNDRENSSFLFIGSYSKNEIGPQHPLAIKLGAIEKENINIKNINIGNLNAQAVNQMISDLLSEPTYVTKPLAELIHHKTHGNAFYVKQFLVRMYDQGLLKYNLALMRWEWDSDKIKAMEITENVAEYFTIKLKDLPPQVKDSMKVASCLGSRFEFYMLEMIMENFEWPIEEQEKWEKCDSNEKREMSGNTNTEYFLRAAINEGLILDEGNGLKYAFVDDQVQRAAFSIIPEDDQNRFRYCIGEILLKKLTAENLDKNLFLVADLLNYRDVAIANTSEEVNLAQLNLRAGQKAMSSLAFAPCLNYTENAIALLGKDCWKGHYALSLQLYNLAAEALYCSGDITKMSHYMDLIRSSAKTFDDKFYSSIIYIDALTCEGRHVEAIRHGLYVLGKAGVYFPIVNSKMHIDALACEGSYIGAIFNSAYSLGKAGIRTPIVYSKPILAAAFKKTKHLLGALSSTDLSLLPRMEDEKKIGIMRLLDTLVVCTYNTKQDLMPHLVLKMVRWSIRYGICKYSPSAFAGYGCMLSASGDFEKGYEFGRMALTMLDRLGADEMTGRVYCLVYAFLNHWTKPVQLSMKPLEHGYQQGMVTGDVRGAMKCLYCHANIAFFTGYPLKSLERELRMFCHQMKDYKQEMMLKHSLALTQLSLNLMGQSEDPLALIGPAMNAGEMLEEAKRHGDIVLVTTIHFFQMMLYYYFGGYEEAGKMIQKTKGCKKYNKASFMECKYTFFEGLIATVLAKRAKQHKWRSHAEHVIKKMKRWAGKGNVNCGHMMCLLEAELCVVKGERDEAERMYKSAISMSGRCGFIHDKALATERLGVFYDECGKTFWATDYLCQAYDLWMKWGAEAKASNLFGKYPDVIIPAFCKGEKEPTTRNNQTVTSPSVLIVPGPLSDVSH